MCWISKKTSKTWWKNEEENQRLNLRKTYKTQWGNKEENQQFIILIKIKNLQNFTKKTEKNTRYWLIENIDKRSLKTLDQKLKHKMQIWGYKKHNLSKA